MLDAWVRRVGAIGCGGCLLLAGCKSNVPPSSEEPATAEQPLAQAEPEEVGPVAQDAAFVAKLVAPANFVVGQSSQVRLELEAKAPFHCNEQYPYKFTLDASSGLKTAQPVVTKENFELGESKATANIEVTPLQAGDHTLSGLFAFSVCTDDKCLIERRKLALELSATDAP